MAGQADFRRHRQMVGYWVVNDGNALQVDGVRQQNMIQPPAGTPAGIRCVCRERLQIEVLQRAMAQQHIGFLVEVAHDDQMARLLNFVAQKFELMKLGAFAQRQMGNGNR